MILVFDSNTRTLHRTQDLPESGWIHVVNPDDGELQILKRRGIPDTLVAHALDLDEVARIDRKDHVTLIIVRIPWTRPKDAECPFRSAALGVVLLHGLVITISRDETDISDSICKIDDLAPCRPLRFLIQLVMHVAEQFLSHVRAVDAIVNGLEAKLKASLANQEVLELLRYQKSLVHFTTALGSNKIMLERLAKDTHLQMDANDRELLEDTLVEMHQAIEMAGVSANILSQMMDAFASIISNNLNVVMKVLTSLTLVLTGPILVASIYGMNVSLPGQSSPLAFVWLIAVSSAIAVTVIWFFWRRRWL